MLCRVLDGCEWRELKALPQTWFDTLAGSLAGVSRSSAGWQHLYDLKEWWRCAPSGSEAVSCSFGGFSASCIFRSGCNICLPQCVFDAGDGRSYVEAWYSISLDVEECPAGVVDTHVHDHGADVIKSRDPVDREVFWTLSLVTWSFLFGFVTSVCGGIAPGVSLI